MTTSTAGPTATAASNNKIDSDEFYSEYLGHKEEHLEALLPLLRSNSDSLIWLAGDSSLDNKYWFQFTQPAVGAYQEFLDPPRSKTDVTFWLNFLALNDPKLSRIATINTSVEETTLNYRTFQWLPQDRFLRDNIGSDDILIVSVGGNDVAWAPCPCTVASVLCLVNMPLACLERGFTYGVCPTEEYCCGCCSSLASCLCSCPPCLGYFRHLFGTRTEKYINSIVAKRKPKMVLICMIYYPDETSTMSWATLPLSLLGYDRDPSKLQFLISKAYEKATSTIKVPGTQVITVPLFHVLDGKHSEDYCERVEPSPSGGKLMAQYFLDIISKNMSSKIAKEEQQQQSTALPPITQQMTDRG